MKDDILPDGAVPEDEMMILYGIVQRLRERGLPVEEIVKLAEAFARDDPPKRSPRHA
jgi:hypothetical protein